MRLISLAFICGVIAPPPLSQGNGCFPPAEPFPNECGSLDWNPNYSCSGANFNLTSGRWFACSSHQDCYNRREPNEWCYLPSGYQWIEKGCFCDEKLGSCIIERASYDSYEWSYCISESEFICNQPTGICY